MCQSVIIDNAVVECMDIPLNKSLKLLFIHNYCSL